MIRLTALYSLFPRRFLDTDFNWQDFNVERWSREYEWEQDDWNGKKDTVKEPTVALDEYGDCDDYSVVILSYLVATTDHDLELVTLARFFPFQGHIVVYDKTEEIVYSSGAIRNMTIDEYLSASTYKHTFRRNVQ